MSDNKRYPSLSWPFSSFVAGWNLFGHSLYSSKLSKDIRTEVAHQDWFSPVVSYAGQWSHSLCLCSPCVGIYETRIPQSPGVICVIITIITLRLQEIITVASEEKPCLSAVSATSHAYREHQSSVGVEASCANVETQKTSCLS